MSTTTETTADYSALLFGGESTTKTNENTKSTEETPAPTPPQQGNGKAKGKAKQTADTGTEKVGTLRSLAAEKWAPRDFAAVAPAPLADAVTGHRDRYQGLDNIGVKVLYAIYAGAAVPVGVGLNVISLLLAHTSTLINEPHRWKEAFLGIVFLAIVSGALVWVGM